MRAAIKELSEFSCVSNEELFTLIRDCDYKLLDELHEGFMVSDSPQSKKSASKKEGCEQTQWSKGEEQPSLSDAVLLEDDLSTKLLFAAEVATEDSGLAVEPQQGMRVDEEEDDLTTHLLFGDYRGDMDEEGGELEGMAEDTQNKQLGLLFNYRAKEEELHSFIEEYTGGGHSHLLGGELDVDQQE